MLPPNRLQHAARTAFVLHTLLLAGLMLFLSVAVAVGISQRHTHYNASSEVVRAIYTGFTRSDKSLLSFYISVLLILLYLNLYTTQRSELYYTEHLM